MNITPKAIIIAAVAPAAPAKDTVKNAPEKTVPVKKQDSAPVKK